LHLFEEKQMQIVAETCIFLKKSKLQIVDEIVSF